jgi:RNA polymerase sigma factor (sigma-70 family)
MQANRAPKGGPRLSSGRTSDEQAGGEQPDCPLLQGEGREAPKGIPGSSDSRPIAGEKEARAAEGTPARRTATAGEWLNAPALSQIVTRIVTRYGLDRADLPDLLQEMRIALWKLGLHMKVSVAWVIRVATNKAVDVLRRTVRRRARDEAYAQLPGSGATDVELEHLLHARITELSLRLRNFYNLHYQEGWSERELALRLGICRASVRWLDQGCRKRILGPVLVGVAQTKSLKRP